MSILGGHTRLRKELTLLDVYAISTGAMFSSGFFLLPGLATAQAGPSAVLAYLFASFFILPAMFSMAELATAMPRAGGAYYFIDRALGPMAGTVGGLGTWLALVLKSAFALIGMGAYLAFFVDIPIRPLAVLLTLMFMVVNIAGAKETGGLQRVLVFLLVSILLFFIVQGLAEVVIRGPAELNRQYTPFMPFGVGGLLSTVGLVFVSYAGLTKVASVAEEVRNPDRNLPLGMILSLITATTVYVVGVFIMVAVLEPMELRSDLTPVATAAESFFDWLPEPTGLILIVIAAVAAFASTGNAGIMSASRYPLAMARDRLIPRRFATLSRFGTPSAGIIVTSGAMILFLVLVDIEGIAKLASAFQLLLFSMLNLTVVIMRQSGIDSYDPGYRSPLYPGMQIFGMLGPLWLIAEMGRLPILFTFGMIAIGLLWYFYYAQQRVVRSGAIFHVFEKLGRRRFSGLDRELRDILKERGVPHEDPLEDVVARALVIDAASDQDFDDLVSLVSGELAGLVQVDEDELRERFVVGRRAGDTPVTHGVALPHLRLPGLAHPELVLVRSRTGVRMPAPDYSRVVDFSPRIHAFFFLISPEDEPAQHLRILAEIASRIDAEDFMERWRGADTDGLRQALLGEQHFLSLTLAEGTNAGTLIGQLVRELDMPEGSLIAVIHRAGKIVVPRGGTRLAADDRLTVIGDPAGIAELEARYGGSLSEGSRDLPETLS
ncbi:MAG TPA: amino acid permease [Longimicrobiales bacterium]|nr:amino acid permease [Longimicrobiales bacterium]